ncbi:efflux RND transporter periplasmic adaptor subunit [Schlesneria paludicola]|uniref:efflux RND transporter periplasmic adaptor subunit n=1 Tax=Schlesneria paludicola TaxID=360056 RepID=UPI00029A9235|nr:efflux RND transporter periplasmic adaptor subunit [Schlesneria paludicola]
MKSDSTPPTTHARKGGARRRILVILGVLGVCLAAGGGAVYSFRGEGAVQAITRRPIFGEFVNDIVERGDVESSSNTELRCEVSSSEGVRILELVAEGTLVNPGDVVISLDDSTIKKDLNAQRITVNTVEAAYSKAKNELAAARQAREEYEKGTFVQDEQKLQSELFVAEEQSRRAKATYEYGRKMRARGFITDSQLEGELFSVKRYDKDRDAATTKLMVLREYTKPKTLIKHESDIKTNEAAEFAEKAKYEIELAKLAKLEEQLEKCVIKATTTGQVVYNNQDRWRGDEYFVRKGNRVRERQVLVKLPDIGQMQVKAKIGEARVDRVKPGMEAIIRVEAMRGSELKGIVKTVSAYASDEMWYNPNTKEYDAIITITDPPATLKPGMTSQVAIRVETQQDVLQVPVQSVVERTGKHYSIVREQDGKLSLRELSIGSSNEKFIIVKEGLGRDDEVVMNPRPHLARVGLKDVEVDPNGAKPADDAKGKTPATTKTPATPVAGESPGRGA